MITNIHVHILELTCTYIRVSLGSIDIRVTGYLNSDIPDLILEYWIILCGFKSGYPNPSGSNLSNLLPHKSDFWLNYRLH